MINKIIEILSDFVDFDESEVNGTTRLRSDIGLNSFDFVNVAVQLEKEFGVKIPDKEMSKLKTVGEIETLLQKKLATA